MRLPGWYYGWKATIRLWLFDRATYRQLKEPVDIEDFVEVQRPEGKA